jgi:hypothetical protein
MVVASESYFGRARRATSDGEIMRRTIFVLAAAIIVAAFGESCGSSSETKVYDGGGAGGGGQGGSSPGSGACTLTGNLTAGCEVIAELNQTVTLHSCDAYSNPDLASFYLPNCTTQSVPGTVVSSCPTTGLLGVCNLCGHSSFSYSDVVGANAANEQSTCIAMGGTWVGN